MKGLGKGGGEGGEDEGRGGVRRTEIGMKFGGRGTGRVGGGEREAEGREG